MTSSPSPHLPAEFLARLLPSDVVWRVGRIDAMGQDLHPTEAAIVARAVPKRRREFAAGRQCAREAVRGLCGAASPIAAGADRAPVWPEGVVGSITHNDVFSAAAVAWSSQLMGLGIDVDTVARFDESLTAALCTPGEVRRWLAGQDESLRRQRLATLFSVKEAFYKAQYTFSRAWLGFHDVEIKRWDALDDGRSFLQLAVIKPPQPRADTPFNPAAVPVLMGRCWDSHSAGDAHYVWASVLMRR